MEQTRALLGIQSVIAHGFTAGGYVSLSDPLSTNGHTQSGGHWNVAFRMVARGSGKLGTPQWSSRSGDGSANGILYIIGATLRKSVAQRSDPLRHKTRKPERPRGRPHQFLYSPLLTIC